MTDAALSLDRPRPAALPGLGYASALVLTGIATLAAVVVDRWTPIPNLSLVFVLPVVIVAVSFGWGPALVAAVAGVAAFNFFLIEPRHTLRVDDPANAWALVLLLATAAIVSAVAAQARRKAIEATRHAARNEALQDLAKALVAAKDRHAIASAAAQSLARLFGAPAAVLLMQGEQLQAEATAGGATLSPADLDAARWSLASRLPSRGRSYPIEDAGFDFWPVVTRSRRQAAVGLAISGGDAGRPKAPERMVDMVCGYLAVALERDYYADQALQARLETESQKLKADLLAAVSHDLRTPLSTILFTLQSLQRFDAAHPPETRAELLALAEAETARLAGLVANLLDMSRIDADAVTVKTAPAALADLVASAAVRACVADRVRPEESDTAEVEIDYALAETALANVLENAGKYSTPGSPIDVRTCREGPMAVIEVADHGAGFPEAIEPLFEKFARGVEGDGRPPGTGLGLAIARGFLTAMGGRIEAANRPDAKGAVVRILLPLAQAPA